MGRKRKTPVAVSPDPDSLAGSDIEAGETEEGIARQPGGVKGHGANERERARMRVLSKAFGRLKTTLPWVPADTKLSKLDTLRLASSYIAHLRRVLQAEAGDTDFNPGGAPPQGGSAAGAAAAATGQDGAPSAASNREHHSRGSSTPSIHPITLTWPYTAHNRIGGASSAGRPRDAISTSS